MPERGESLRLFVALAVAPEVKAELVSVQDALRAQLPRMRAAWNRPESMHLTLRFLGQVLAESLESLQQALGAVAVAGRPLELEAVAFGCFPSPSRPRVLWVGVQDKLGVLSQLQVGVQSATAPFTLEPAEGDFKPHLTLARIKEASRPDRMALADWIRQGASRKFGRWNVGHIDLMRSELHAAGSRHAILARLPLGGER